MADFWENYCGHNKQSSKTTLFYPKVCLKGYAQVVLVMLNLDCITIFCFTLKTRYTTFAGLYLGSITHNVTLMLDSKD